MSKEKSFIIKCSAGQQGQRLDQFLAVAEDLKSSGLTRSQIKQLVDAQKVSVNAVAAGKAGHLLRAGDEICVMLPVCSAGQQQKGYDFDLDLVYEDKDLVVINKPAGLTVHPGAGTGTQTLLNALIAHYLRSSGKLPPVFDSVSETRGGIVHRLDKDTTGLMVVAKTLMALQSLGKQFSERSIDRYYCALVFSTPRANRVVNRSDSGEIDLPLGRDPKRRVSMAVDGVARRQALSRWRVVERFNYATLVELKLATGRTHQIRVHMNAVGSPVIGDRTYGDFSGLPKSLSRIAGKFGRQALHARSLFFNHPRSGQRLSFDSQPPADMLDLIEIFRKFPD